MRKLFALCIGIGVGLPGVAAAEVMDMGQPVPQRARTGGQEAQLPPPKKIIFGEEDPVVGELPSGDGLTIRTTTARKFGSLIKLRGSFVPEMLKSAENF